MIIGDIVHVGSLGRGLRTRVPFCSKEDMTLSPTPRDLLVLPRKLSADRMPPPRLGTGTFPCRWSPVFQDAVHARNQQAAHRTEPRAEARLAPVTIIRGDPLVGCVLLTSAILGSAGLVVLVQHGRSGWGCFHQGTE